MVNRQAERDAFSSPPFKGGVRLQPRGGCFFSSPPFKGGCGFSRGVVVFFLKQGILSDSRVGSCPASVVSHK